MQRSILVFAVALAAAALPLTFEHRSIASAQDASASSAEAQALFRRGVELGEQDRWAEALEIFRRSREIAERPNTVFNIAFALHRLGRFTQSLDVFDEYLAVTEGETSERRDEAVRLRGEALASLAEIELEVVPHDARVLVDGEAAVVAAGSPRVLRLDPGRHVLRGTAPGYEEGVLSTAVLAGERGGRTLALTPRGAVAPGSDPPLGHDDPPPGRSVLEEPLFWVIAGVVLAGAGVGIGVGVAVSSQDAPLYGGSTGVVLESLRF